MRCCLMQGTVRLLFQPAEEGGAGGDLMVREGERLRVDGERVGGGGPAGIRCCSAPQFVCITGIPGLRCWPCPS